MVDSTRQTDLSNHTFQRILLIKPSSLGDVVHALPVLHGLRQRYPYAGIDWLIATPLAPLLAGHPEVNEFVCFDRRRFGRLGRSLEASKEFAQFLRELRARSYDLVIDLQGLFRTGFLSFATGAPVRIGFRNAREAAWLFYTHRIIVDGRDLHAVDRNYHVARMLGFSDVPVRFNLALPEPLRAEAAELLVQTGLSSQQRIVAVVPGARWETKMWLPERFAETIDALQADPTVRCVLLGGPDEAQLGNRIAVLCRSAPLNLMGRTTLPCLAAVLGLADCVLGHDSGPMHLAVALNCPLVCLVGPTNPRRTGPYRRGDDVIQLKLECSPCYFRRLSQCPYDHQCMRDLDTATVVAAVTKTLKDSCRSES